MSRDTHLMLVGRPVRGRNAAREGSVQIRKGEMGERAVGRLETWQVLVRWRDGGDRRETICTASDNVWIHAASLTMLIYSKEGLDARQRRAGAGVCDHIDSFESVRGDARASAAERG